MTEIYDRDLIGYGANPPDPQWPNSARLALNFVINVEEGSEPSVQDGEGFTEIQHTEAFGRQLGLEGRDLAGEGMFEFGSRVGIWRLLRMFEERDLLLTLFACAVALERNPPLAEVVRKSGYDVCSHGWRWIKHYQLSETEEREQIRKAIQSLEATTGQRPLGWYCRYGPSLNTRRLVVEHGGFLYDSDYYGDELPFWKTVNGQPHLVVPYSLTNNDGKYAGWLGTSDAWFSFIRDAFDILYEEGKSQPKMMSVGLHPRLIGHPARAMGLKRFLDYVATKPDVWITRRVDIANHWVATHPYPGKGLNE
jgi:allantoinase